jgi:ribosomal protein S18 acetylase RimI-like enzyme
VTRSTQAITAPSDNPSGDLLQLLRGLEAKTARAVANGRETARIGRFLAAAHPTNDLIWLNYALPLPELAHDADITGDIADLRQWFRERGRVLRFEIFQPLWPRLGPALERAGLRLQGAMPLMLCAPGDLRPIAAPGVTVRRLDDTATDDTLRQVMATGQAAFDQPSDVRDADLAELRDNLRRGVYRSGYAEFGGSVAGIGTVVTMNDELAGIGTLPQYRRRGIAATLSTALLADHFAAGATMAWLSAGDDPAHATYAKIGFRDAGVQLNYIDADPAGH